MAILLFIILGVSIFLFGILFGGFITDKGWASTTFFQFRLFELMQLAVTITIALIVAFFINRKINHMIKQKDLLKDVLEKFQGDLNEVARVGYDYINGPDKIKEGKVKKGFKDLGIWLSILKDIKEKGHAMTEYNESFFADYMNYKELITDDPFGTENPVYTSDRRERIQSQYGVLLSRIYKCKIDLYT